MSKIHNSISVYKTDDDRRLVFGWASVVMTIDGQPVEDRQHDVIACEELETAAYEYVLQFGDAGEEHEPSLRKKGRLVESCVFTEEKQRAMGLPAGVLPVGWWIGFRIDDDAAWEKIKDGTYRMFSIEGRATRTPIPDDDPPRFSPDSPNRFDFIQEIDKFNPYHDHRGRFTSAANAVAPTANAAAPVTDTVDLRADAVDPAADAVDLRANIFARAVGAIARAASSGSFTPAKNVKEAVEYATKQLGFQKVDYGTISDMDTINHINIQISLVQQKYPETKGAVQGLTTISLKDVFARMRAGDTGQMVLAVSTEMYGKGLKSLEEKYAASVSTGYFPEGTDARAAIWHEYGHVMAAIALKKQQGFKPSEVIQNPHQRDTFSTEWGKHSLEEKWLSSVAAKAGVEPARLAATISGYAFERGAAETFAEAFAEVNVSASPRASAKMLVGEWEKATAEANNKRKKQ